MCLCTPDNFLTETDGEHSDEAGIGHHDDHGVIKVGKKSVFGIEEKAVLAAFLFVSGIALSFCFITGIGCFAFWACFHGVY
jgi:hypothetical protein